MAGTKKLSEWQKRRKTLIENLSNNPDFTKGLDYLRANLKVVDFGKAASSVIARFQLPIDCYETLNNYLKTGKWDYELIKPPIQVISTKDMVVEPSNNPSAMYAVYKKYEEYGGNFLYLHLDSAMTQSEALSFIRKYWKTLIEPMLPDHQSLKKRIRSKPKAKRNYRIKQLLEQNKTHRDIEDIINEEFPDDIAITADDVRRNIYDIKKRRI